MLVNFYVKNLKEIYNNPELTVDVKALLWLEKQDFHGNIRQLKNLVERVVLVSNNKTITEEDFQTQYRGSLRGEKINLPDVGEISLEDMEVKMIKKALAYHRNKISATAKSLGITRSALYRRLEKYDISLDVER